MSEPETLDDLAKLATCGVPQFGRIVHGLSTTQSYAAAKRGDIPTTTVNGVMRVLVHPELRRLGVLRDEHASQASEREVEEVAGAA